jgi:hypothetical protein
LIPNGALRPSVTTNWSWGTNGDHMVMLGVPGEIKSRVHSALDTLLAAGYLTKEETTYRFILGVTKYWVSSKFVSNLIAKRKGQKIAWLTSSQALALE